VRRHEHRREDNINLDLKEIGREMWIGFTWLRIQCDEPSGFMKFWDVIAQLSNY
jgi:hypothetical protein